MHAVRFERVRLETVPERQLFGGFRRLLALPKIPGAQVRLIDDLVGLLRFLGAEERDRPADLDRLCLQACIDLAVYIARNTASGRLDPTTAMPWPRMSTTAALPSASAKALPSWAFETSMSVIPPALRISNTGTRGERNAEMWNVGCIGAWVVPNGMTEGECAWITAFTSGRAL